MKIAIVQLNSTDDKSRNLAIAAEQITQICEQQEIDLITLPEMFNFMGGSISEKKTAAENIENGETVILLKQLARKYGIFIHGGSIGEQESNKYYNTTPIINPNGQLIAKYRKINLFNFKGTSANYNEASTLSPGHEIITYPVDKYIVACAICFDLRFSRLFETFKKINAKIIVIPSAFTYETGQAHWEILLRARAIETQSFVIAPAQTGSYFQEGQQRVNWGHSMVIDPWGNILAQLNENVGHALVHLDFKFLEQVREKLPMNW
jgi:nitrilase